MSTLAIAASDTKISEPLVFRSSGQIRRLTSEGRSIYIEALVEPAVCIPPDTPIQITQEMLGVHEPINALVVTIDEKPVGLIGSLHLDRILSMQHGVALFYKKPVFHVMDGNFLKIEAGTTLEVAAGLAMQCEKTKIFDHVICLAPTLTCSSESWPKRSSGQGRRF